MNGILSEFIHRLNSNKFYFSDGNAILPKSLFLHTFSWDLSLFSVLMEWRQFKPKKALWCFELFRLNDVDSFLIQGNDILHFFCLESLIELFVFHNSNQFLRYKLDICNNCCVLKTLALDVWIFWIYCFSFLFCRNWRINIWTNTYKIYCMTFAIHQLNWIKNKMTSTHWCF